MHCEEKVSYLDASLDGNLSQQGDPLETMLLYDLIYTVTEHREDEAVKSCCTYLHTHSYIQCLHTHILVKCVVVIISSLSPDPAPQLTGGQSGPHTICQ